MLSCRDSRRGTGKNRGRAKRGPKILVYTPHIGLLLFFLSGGSAPRTPRPKGALFSVLVFGPEWVSYERSRGIRRWVLREISARVFFVKYQNVSCWVVGMLKHIKHYVFIYFQPTSKYTKYFLVSKFLGLIENIYMFIHSFFINSWGMKNLVISKSWCALISLKLPCDC